MTTPMQRHMERVRKEQAEKELKEKLDAGIAGDTEIEEIDYSEFEVIKQSLANDIKTEGTKTQGEERNAFRLSVLIPRYYDFINRYLNDDEVYANPVLVQMIIWLLDLGRISDALKLSYVAVEEGQKMPSHFNRNLATFVADNVRNWAESEMNQVHSISPYFDDVLTTLYENEKWLVPDVTKMKFEKIAGIQALEDKDYEKAILHFNKAEHLSASNYPAKVKTKLNQAIKALELQAEQDKPVEILENDTIEVD